MSLKISILFSDYLPWYSQVTKFVRVKRIQDLFTYDPFDKITEYKWKPGKCGLNTMPIRPIRHGIQMVLGIA